MFCIKNKMKGKNFLRIVKVPFFEQEKVLFFRKNRKKSNSTK